MVILVFLFACVFLGLLLAGIIAPFAIWQNRKIARQMNAIVERYQDGPQSPAGKAEAIKELYALLSQMHKADKNGVEAARDMILSLG